VGRRVRATLAGGRGRVCPMLNALTRSVRCRPGPAGDIGAPEDRSGARRGLLRSPVAGSTGPLATERVGAPRSVTVPAASGGGCAVDASAETPIDDDGRAILRRCVCRSGPTTRAWLPHRSRHVAARLRGVARGAPARRRR
jgi:hypothetical protein